MIHKLRNTVGLHEIEAGGGGGRVCTGLHEMGGGVGREGGGKGGGGVHLPQIVL